MKTERRYDIDWLRVIAIGLLLIYHIAIVFQPWAMFIGFIRSDELSEGLWKPMTMLNVWRIPLLFYVSGMGVYFAIQKRNWGQLLHERSIRILLPFLFGIVAIVPLHLFLFQSYYNMPLAYFPHKGHLWFLGNIFAYVLLLSPLLYYLKKRENGRIKKFLAAVMSNPLGPLSLCLFFVMEVMILKPQLFELYAETWHGFALGLLAFLSGFIAVYSGKAFWNTLSKWKLLYLMMAFGLYAIRLFTFELNAPDYLVAIESNCWIFALFGFGHQYLNKGSKTLDYLSKAAYPIYIVHMFALYAGATIILPLELPVMLKFFAIVVFTTLLCFGLYEFVIRRNRFIRPFFGLKPQVSAKQARKDEIASDLVNEEKRLKTGGI